MKKYLIFAIICISITVFAQENQKDPHTQIDDLKYKSNDDVKKLLEEYVFLANIFQINGKKQEAVAILEKANVLDPNNNEITNMLYDAYKASSNWKKLVKIIEQLNKTTPEPQHFFDLAECYIRLDQKEKAVKVFKQVLITTNDRNTYMTVIGNLTSLNQIDEAIKIATEALGVHNSNQDFVIKLANLYTLKKDYDKAAKTYMDAIEVAQNDYMKNTIENAFASSFSKANKFNVFLDYKLKLLNTQTENLFSIYSELIARSKTPPDNKEEELTDNDVKDILKKIKRLFPVKPQANKNEDISKTSTEALKNRIGDLESQLANEYLKLKDIFKNNEKPAKSIEMLEKAVILLPDNTGLKLDLAKIHFFDKKYKKAIPIFTEYIIAEEKSINDRLKDEKNENVRNNLIRRKEWLEVTKTEINYFILNSYKKIGDQENAKKYQDIINTYKPNDEKAHIDLARRLDSFGLYEYAEVEYDKVLSIKPDNSINDYYACEELSTRNIMALEFETGLKYLQKQKEIYNKGKENDQQLKNLLVDLKRFQAHELQISAKIALNKKDYPKALELALKANDMIQNNLEIVSTIIIAYDKLNKKEESEKYFEQLFNKLNNDISIAPRTPSLYNQLAWFCALVGKRLEDGISLSKKSLEWMPNEPAYLDTIAELYYQNKEYEKALDYMLKAVKNFNQPPLYYQKQIKKMKAALELDKENK